MVELACTRDEDDSTLTSTYHFDQISTCLSTVFGNKRRTKQISLISVQFNIFSQISRGLFRAQFAVITGNFIISNFSVQK